MTPIGLFKGERALVTGSASNIGRAIALALAREGAAVRCVDIDAARNAVVVEEIVKAGGTAESVIVDLSTTDGWRAALPGVGQPIHLFVHSASPARRETDTALAVLEFFRTESSTKIGQSSRSARASASLGRESTLISSPSRSSQMSA